LQKEGHLHDQEKMTKYNFAIILLFRLQELSSMKSMPLSSSCTDFSDLDHHHTAAR